MQYPNIYYSSKATSDFMDSTSAQYSSNSVPGFTTTQKTRPLIIAKLEEFIRNKVLKINSLRTLNELDTFVWVNGRPEAQKGYNDDLVMAAAIACWVRDTAVINNERNLEYAKAFLTSFAKSRTYLNTSIVGMNNYEYNQKIQQQQNQAKEFLWLVKG
jgi:hypothetical protein